MSPYTDTTSSGYQEHLGSTGNTDKWFIKGDPEYTKMIQRRGNSDMLQRLRTDVPLEQVIEMLNRVVQRLKFEEEGAALMQRFADEVQDAIVGFEVAQESLEASHARLKKDQRAVQDSMDKLIASDMERQMRLEAMLQEIEAEGHATIAEARRSVNEIETAYLAKFDDLEIQLKDLAEVVEELEDRVDAA